MFCFFGNKTATLCHHYDTQQHASRLLYAAHKIQSTGCFHNLKKSVFAVSVWRYEGMSEFSICIVLLTKIFLIKSQMCPSLRGISQSCANGLVLGGKKKKICANNASLSIQFLLSNKHFSQLNIGLVFSKTHLNLFQTISHQALCLGSLPEISFLKRCLHTKMLSVN